jgi:hypothetical protein
MKTKSKLFTTALLAIMLMMFTTNAFAGGEMDVLQQVQDALKEVPGMGGYESATGFSFSEAQERADMIGGKDIPMAGPANPTPTPTMSDYSGTYYLSADNGIVFEIESNTALYVRQNTFKNQRNQQWRFEKQKDGTYKIYSVGSGRLLTSFVYLTPSGGYSTRFIQFNDLGETIRYPHLIPASGHFPNIDALFINQCWKIESVGNNQIKIEHSRGNSYRSIDCLAIGTEGFQYVYFGLKQIPDGEEYENELGQRFNLFPVNGNLDRFTAIADGVYRIQPRFRPRSVPEGLGFIEIGSDPLNGNPQLSHVWNSAGDANSNWRFQRQSDGTYTITHVATGKAMAIMPLPGIDAALQQNAAAYAQMGMTIEDVKWAGALVVIQDRNNNPEQRWWIVNSGRGFHFLVNAKNDNAYRIEDWDGSKFLTGESNLLYGWFRFIKQ